MVVTTSHQQLLMKSFVQHCEVPSYGGSHQGCQAGVASRTSVHPSTKFCLILIKSLQSFNNAAVAIQELHSVNDDIAELTFSFSAHDPVATAVSKDSNSYVLVSSR